MNDSKRDLSRGLCIATALVGALAAAPAGNAGADGPCVVARVPAPIVLPDGTRHDAGSLRICLTRVHSPVAGLHRTYIDGQAIGMFQSRRRPAAEAPRSGGSFLVFVRGSGSALHLVGYQIGGSDEPELYEFRTGTVVERSTPRFASRDGTDSLVALAAVAY